MLLNRLIAFLVAMSMLVPSSVSAVNINGELKKALLEKLSADPTGYEGRVYYNTTTQKAMVYKTAGGWQELAGSAGGSGEISYIDNRSGATDTTGWTCVGDLSITRTDTAGDLPRENTTGTGLKIIAGTTTTEDEEDYCYYNFTLDDIDLNRKLNIKFATKQSGSYVADDLAVIITTQAAITTGTAAAITAAAITPIVTNIAAADYDFDANGFDTASTTTLSLVIRATADMTDAAGIVISDVIVGPGKIQPVPAIGTTENFSPTLGGTTTDGTVTFNATYINGYYNRVSDIMVGEVTVVVDTVTSAPTGTYTLKLPTGFTHGGPVGHPGIDAVVGNGTYYDSSATTYIPIQITYAVSTDELKIIKASDIAIPTMATGDSVNANFTASIAEWAGATNYAGSNEVEYYSTSGTWDAASSTTTYGPSGTIMGGALTAARTKTITTLTSIQATDIIELQLNTGYGWHSIESYGYGFVRQNTTYYGAYLQVTGTNTIAVTFNQYGVPSGATYASAGSAWSSSFYWRVVKARSGQAIGFGAATSTASGLVSEETSGNFTLTATGFTTTPTTTGYYTRTGKQVTIAMSGDISATSNATTFTLTGMPSTLYPARNTDGPMSNLRDNTGSFVVGSYRVTSAGVIELYLAGRGGFTASGTKALLQNSFTYYVD